MRSFRLLRVAAGRSWSSTVAHEEATKFSRVDWWREGGEMMTSLHSMNSLRVPLVTNTLLRLPPEATPTSCHTPLPLRGYTVLDVGCGAGFLSEPLARLGAKVTGLEVSGDVLSVAEEHGSHDPEVGPRVEYRCESIEDHWMKVGEGEGGRRYDCVVASEVVEHVADLNLFLTFLTSCVKPGGHTVFTTINRTPSSFALAIVAAEYLLGLLPRGAHDWRKFVTPEELREGVEGKGLEVGMVRGMSFRPLTTQWVWSEDRSVNYALVAHRPF